MSSNTRTFSLKYVKHLFQTRVRPPITKTAIEICATLTDLKISPKEFLFAFLTQPEDVLVERRRIWTKEGGWATTLDILYAIKNLCFGTTEGKGLWRDFVMSEVSLSLLYVYTPFGVEIVLMLFCVPGKGVRSQ